jgi:(2Fe-2S) ferredoxin
MKRNTAPYIAHLLICIKSRDGARKSCGDSTNPELKAILKEEIKKRGWKPQVRISESSCLGLCDAGPNMIIYPQKIWLSEVTPDDVPEILELVGEVVEG